MHSATAETGMLIGETHAMCMNPDGVTPALLFRCIRIATPLMHFRLLRICTTGRAQAQVCNQWYMERLSIGLVACLAYAGTGAEKIFAYGTRRTYTGLTPTSSTTCPPAIVGGITAPSRSYILMTRERGSRTVWGVASRDQKTSITSAPCAKR